jgi:bifunctional DNA-binding transcriptional regulator/antitoxin component of YhaV-PrlF toxin-antitoxin module
MTAILHRTMKSYHVSVQSRGTIALPAELRRRHHLDEPGAQVQIIEHEDGRLELQPMLPIPADQRWFWTERWQAMEREADEDIAAGRVLSFDDVDAFIAHLERHRGE